MLMRLIFACYVVQTLPVITDQITDLDLEKLSLEPVPT